jgi:hypothetical protein
MSAYKQFTTKDIVITPFSTNKGFSFTGNAMTASDVGVEIYFGTQPPANKLIYPTSLNQQWYSYTTGTVSGSQNATGFVNKLNTNSVYSSIMQLYYSNYFESMSGSLVATSSLLYGLEGPVQNNPLTNNQSNNIPIGAIKSPQYDNYLSSTITQTRTALLGEAVTWGFGQVPNQNFISVISIPSKLWGKNIEPQSFSFKKIYPSSLAHYQVWDDGNGVLRYNIDYPSVPANNKYNQYCGNIIYEHGIAILTPVSESNFDPPFVFNNPSLAGVEVTQNQDGYNAGTNDLSQFTVGWSSSVTLYEHQYKCVVRENEFGYSLNPSLLSGSQLTQPLPGTNYVYKDFATGSYFSPYITTIGLYDDNQNLLAIGKLSSPTKVPMKADLEIQVSFDSL